jgi:hypothetical protein
MQLCWLSAILWAMPKQPPVLGRRETIELLLTRSLRPKDAVPIRNSFVQQGPQGKPRPGPLASFVTQRRERALELFLLAHAVASGGDFSVTEWATTWARSLGMFDESSGPTLVSRNWRWLAEQRLVDRSRGEKGRTRITVLREDGKGKPYSHPHGKNKKTARYFQLPFDYWLSPAQWHTALSLPGKAMLLVTLSLTRARFPMPQGRVQEWYGLSEDTAARGLMELRKTGALEVAAKELYPSLQSRTGYAEQYIYELRPPFDLKSRGMGRRPRRKKG